jgi:NADH-quinone oxidoreductase subunit L
MLSLGALGVAAAILHLLAHGVSKALLFLGAGSVTHGTGKTDIREMGGLWRRMPLTSITFIIGAASLAGIVPLSGFFSKEEVLYAVLEHRHPALLVLALAASVLSVLYMARVTFLVFFGPDRGGGDAHESPLLMTLPLLLLAPLALALGIITFGWSDAYPGFGSFLTGAGRHSAEPLLLGVSVGIVSGGIWACWSYYVINRRPEWEPSAVDLKAYPVTARITLAARWLNRLIANGYYVDALYQWAVDRVVLATSRFVALFDRIVVNDTGVDGSAWTVMLSALRLRYVQSGKVYNYGMAMAVGALGLGLIWWALAG